MPRTLTVQPKASRRVAQVRAGQTTLSDGLSPAIEEMPPASPLEQIPVAEQLAQIDALLAASTPKGYSKVLRESGWAKLTEARLVELEEKSRALGVRIKAGHTAINDREATTDRPAPTSWYETVAALILERADVDEAHRNLLWQYERQMGRASWVRDGPSCPRARIRRIG
jgi:hypothetical protein